jgi:hypothetical protein
MMALVDCVTSAAGHAGHRCGSPGAADDDAAAGAAQEEAEEPDEGAQVANVSLLQHLGGNVSVCERVRAV